MHIGEIKSVAMEAHRDAQRRDGLFASMLNGEGRDAYYAAWALTHLPPSDNSYIDVRREDLVRLAVSTSEIPLRRLSLALLERLAWGMDDVRTDLLDFCLEHMMLPEEPYGIKALCMKLAYQQCRHYPELCAELKQNLLLLEPSELGAGVRHTRGKILKLL